MDDTQLILLFSIVGSLVIIFLLVLLFWLNKTKEVEEPKEDLNKIKELFGRDNIISVERTQKRVRVEVKDLSKVSLEELQPLTNGIFITGNRVVATFKDDTDEIMKILGG